jgi:hypothetical protein
MSPNKFIIKIYYTLSSLKYLAREANCIDQDANPAETSIRVGTPYLSQLKRRDRPASSTHAWNKDYMDNRLTENASFNQLCN